MGIENLKAGDTFFERRGAPAKILQPWNGEFAICRNCKTNKPYMKYDTHDKYDFTKRWRVIESNGKEQWIDADSTKQAARYWLVRRMEQPRFLMQETDEEGVFELQSWRQHVIRVVEADSWRDGQ